MRDMLDITDSFRQMARPYVGHACVLIVGLLAACGGSREPGAAQEPAAVEEPAAPAAGDSPAAAPEEAAAEAKEEAPVVVPEDAPAAAADDAPAPALIAIGELGGRYGFDWLHPKSTRCKKLDQAFIRKLEKAKATCTEREPGESFGIDVGPWHSCAAGDQEWLIFATRENCIEAFETMMANAE